MRAFLLTCVMLALVANVSAAAQTQSVERTSKGESGKDIRIGVYLNIQPDCTSGPLPTIRLSEPPTHGKVVVKKATASATNLKQCLALQVPAYVALYRSNRNFIGTDLFVLEVKYPNGRMEVQHITVMVEGKSPGQPI
jgi:uncharacterized membrane protein